MIFKDLLKVLEEIKKDLAYIQRLEGRWVREEKRFPLIYEHIVKQRVAFEKEADDILGTQIDGAFLSEYVRNRPGIKVERIKTTQVTPPEERDEEPQAVAEKPEAPKPELPRPEPFEEQAPAPKPPPAEAAEPQPFESAEPDVIDLAGAALQEASAAAAAKLRQDYEEPATQAVSAAEVKQEVKKPATKKKKASSAEPEKSPRTRRGSSRERLRKLASEVLNEVKKSRTD